MSTTLQRTKAQAIFFLLGAVLVGGALGFSANRVLEHRGGQSSLQRSREQLAEQLRLDPGQRQMLDSVLDARNERMKALLSPVRPQLDSLRMAARAIIRSRLTPDQQVRWDQVLLELSRDTARIDRR
jgi:hypothetical protein